MDVQAQDRPVYDDEIRLKELIQEIWHRRWWVGGTTVLFASLALGASLVMPKMYKAQIVVSPRTDQPGNSQGGGLSSVISQFGGLASLAGISIGGDTHKAETVAVLQSDALTERYITQNTLLPVLYFKQWDGAHHQWNVRDPTKVPTLWKAEEYFKKSVRKVSTDLKTGLVTMTITWNDPHLAATWANGLVKMTNDYLRGRAMQESERNIAFLNEQAAKTDVVGVKEAIFAIMENEIDKEMVARGTDEYALKVIDPAIAPEKASSPQKLLWTLLGAFGGLLIGLFGVFVRMAWVRG